MKLTKQRTHTDIPVSNISDGHRAVVVVWGNAVDEHTLDSVEARKRPVGIDLAGQRGYRLPNSPSVVTCGHTVSTRKRTPRALESRRPGGS